MVVSALKSIIAQPAVGALGSSAVCRLLVQRQTMRRQMCLAGDTFAHSQSFPLPMDFYGLNWELTLHIIQPMETTGFFWCWES